MKRSGPIQRKTPLRNQSPLKATTSKARPRRKTGPSQEVRSLILKRASARCERCGKTSGGLNIHHRQPRGMGGSRATHTNQPSNLMALCGSGTTGCHGWVESHRADAMVAGYLVPHPSKPSNTPVLYRMSAWVLLQDTGGMNSWTPPVEPEE